MAARARLTTAAAASLVVAFAGACGSFGSSPAGPTPPGSDGGGLDAAGDSSADGSNVADGEIPDALAPACAHSKAFGAPAPVPGLPPAGPDCGIALSNDELRAYFSAGMANNQRLMVANRTSLSAEFKANLLAIDVPTSSNIDDIAPAITDDELTVVFASTRNNPGNRTSGYDLFYAERANPIDKFGTPKALTLASSLVNDAFPYVVNDEIWFASPRTTTVFQIFKTTISAQSGPTAVSELNVATKNVLAPVLSKDRLSIYYATVTNGVIAVFRAQRQKPNDSFAAVTALTEFDGRSALPAWLSSDNCRLYLCAKIDTQYFLQVASRSP